MRSRASGVARRQNVNKKKIHDKELRGAIRKRVFQTCNAGRAGAQPYRATRRKGHRAKAGAFGYGGEKLELLLTAGKSWSFRLQRAKAGAFAYKDADEGSETCVYLETALRAKRGIKTIAKTVATMLRPRTTSSPVLRPRCPEERASNPAFPSLPSWQNSNILGNPPSIVAIKYGRKRTAVRP